MLVNQNVTPKQPGESRKYGGDWRPALARFPGVTIVGSAWSLVPGSDGALTLGTAAINGAGDQTSVLLGGGTAGVVYTLKNSVTLSDGQILYGYGVLEVASEEAMLRV
jgi:hypothetical protein